MILPLVLLVLAIAVILGMCFLTSASTATQLSSGVDHRLRARTIAEAEGLLTDGYRAVVNTGANAGQTVSHIHLHLLGGRHFGWPPG